MFRWCAALLLSVSAVTVAWPVPTTVCRRAVGPIAVDGRLNEPTWRKAAPLSPLRDLNGGPAAHSADIRLAYDDDFLYIGAVLPTKTLRARQTARDSIVYHDDDFEVFIDPTGVGRNYLELEINALGTVWDLFLTAPYRAGAACVALHDWDIKGLRSAVTCQGTLNAGEGDDTSWTVELAWPWASITGHSSCRAKGAPPPPARRCASTSREWIIPPVRLSARWVMPSETPCGPPRANPPSMPRSIGGACAFRDGRSVSPRSSRPWWDCGCTAATVR